MSDFIIEILEPTVNIIEIETSYLDQVTDSIEIERFDAFNLEIVNTEKILWSDLPDNIPISKISGNLPVNRIDGLDDYITNFLTDNATVHVDDLIWGIDNVGLSGYLDQYHFDCGNPNSSLQ
jgi:hypothetical protein